ncbi:putative bifunctional diguanylate cyclase/phosphodiesterase [Colwellia hornerae]|uniref:EAL domain-containing protein n=1 Tax=Colwellia hornerae TaxID=89402 RepID=A0A5C6Q4J9_9GAMM|nr:EAL domain-containing protein [Colwellia hornerae]TWX51636.1 EAL domain-containing protein [Colwellia hornerae]TWX57114.1 EAL domain-containing protein [Colwellia hornerae]TWX63823.1 EAL domain-containing protein [Colwellia hornerae]
MTDTELSSGLRKRVLYSSIGLAIIVSAIFISVAFNLSRDLGESLELEHSTKVLSQLTKHIKSVIQHGQFNELTSNKDVKNALTALLDKDIIGFEIWFNNKHIKLKTSFLYAHNDLIDNAIKSETSNYNFIETDTDRLFWIYEKAPLNNLSILMVNETYALDKAISYVSNRLFITAFLTFWLAVWVALFISALVSKRFQQSNDRLKHLATHDIMTGLHNRAYLYEYAHSYFNAENIKKHQNDGTLLAVYIIDLDKFKDINDTMGHLVGDELLKAISIRLCNLKEKSSQAIRYGGDEFVVWCDNLNERRAISLAEDIVTVCRQPIKVNNYAFETSVSVGVSYYPTSGLQLDELLKNADVAMYQAKKHRLGFQVFQQELFTRSAFRINLRGQLNTALEQHQFVLYYQPKVKLPGDIIVGVEALVRWLHPKEGILSPNMFIDIIEQSMFVHEFTRYVLLQAIIQCRAWLDEGLELSIAVNISPYNLMDPELVSYVATQLEHYNVSAGLIEIELTENASMVNITKTQEVFSQFRKLGVKLSIDDFGTGMSSLAYIKHLDVDYIKIDRSFINDVVTDKRDEAVITSLLVLCQKLNKLTIAEGVETIEQANKLTLLGCNLAQGYLYSKPLPAEEITKLLNKQAVVIDNNVINIKT